MKKQLIFLFLLTTVSCFGQMSQLTLYFTPPAIEHSQVLIENINSIYSMTILSSKINETHYLSDSLVAELNQFLADFSQKKVAEDSLLRVRVLEEEKGIDNTLQKRLKGLDVIDPHFFGVRLVIVEGNDSTSYTMNNPVKGTINYTFMKLILKLMTQSFWNYSTETYVEKLEGYFGSGLKVKKQTNSNYKLYGWLSSNEEKELNDLFDQLPSNIPLYFNMQNFEGMDKTLYHAFKSLCDRNPTITWSGCSEKVKQQFKEAGIANLTPMGYSIIHY